MKNLPNILTCLRILLIVPFVALFYWHNPAAPWAALGIYAVAVITDYLDGVLARWLNAQSPFGAMMDQISDKLFVGAVMMTLAWYGNLAGWLLPAAIIILLREIYVSGLREYMALQNIAMPVSKLGKWKTASQMIALGLLIIYPTIEAGAQLYDADLALYPSSDPHQYVFKAGFVLLWVAALLSAISAWQYASVLRRSSATAE